MVLYIKAGIRHAGKNMWIYPYEVTLNPPYIMGNRPNNTSCADPDCLIYVDILDDVQVVQSSITITVGGSNAYTSSAFVAPFNGVSSSITPITYDGDVGYRIIIDNTGSYSGTITVNIIASDNSGDSIDESWSFTVDDTPPYLTDVVPENQIVCYDTLIYYDILDVCSGVREDTLDAYVDGYWALRKGVFADAYDGPSSSITPISVGGQDGYSVCIDNLGSYSQATITIDAYGEDGYGNELWDTWEFSIDLTAPYGTAAFPLSKSCSDTSIRFKILDDYGIYEDMIDAYVDGTLAIEEGVFQSGYSGSIVAVTDGYLITITPDSPLSSSTVKVDAYAADFCGNLMDDYNWSFDIDLTDPYGTEAFPLSKSCSDTQIRFKILDDYGIYEDMIDAYVDGVLAIEEGVFQAGYSGSIVAVTDGYLVTITPDSPLSSSTVKVDAYASDFCGHLLDDYNWSFSVYLNDPYGTEAFPLSKSCSDTSIRFKILDDYGIYEDMIDAYVDGVLAIEDGVFQAGYSGSISSVTDGYLITITPDSPLSSSTVRIDAYASDFCGYLLDDYNWSFSVDLSDPYGTEAFPLTKSCSDTQIRFKILDDYGIYEDMIDAYVDGVLAIEEGVFQSGYSGSITQVTDGYLVTIIPDSALSSSTVKVDAYASDFCGNLMDDYNWSFSVDLSDPYGTEAFPLSKSCSNTQIRFKILDDYGIYEDMIDAYVDGTLAIEEGVFQSGYSGSIVAVTDGYLVTITPDSALSSSTVKVDAYASDFCGNLLDDYNWSFSVDLSDPYGTDATPYTGYSCPNASITFKVLDDYGIYEDMIDAYVDGTLAIENGVFQSGYDGTITPISEGGYDGYSITILPDNPFSSSTIKVDAYASDFCGNLMDDYNWSFNVDVVYPSLDGYSPSSGATNQWSNTTITFNIKDTETGVSQNSIDAYVNGTWVYDGVTDTFKSPFGTSSTITPVSDGYQLYLVNDNEDFTGTVEIDAYASDNCSNTINPATWSFSIDAIPPYLDGYTPTAGSTALANSLIVITMKDDETAVNPLSIDAYVEGAWAYRGDTDTFIAPYNGASSELTTVVDGYQLTIDKTTDYTGGATVTVGIYVTDRGLNSIDDSWQWYATVPIIFYAPLNTSGPNRLDRAVEINSTSVYPNSMYVGSDADASTWDAYDSYGINLAIVNDGTDVRVNAGSPCLDSLSDSVNFVAGDYFQAATTGDGYLSTNDIWIDVMFRFDSATGIIASKRDGTGQGWELGINGSSQLYLTMDDGTDEATVSSAALTSGAWYFGNVAVNRDEASTNGSRCYINFAESGSGVDFSSVDDTDVAQKVTLGATPAGTSNFDGYLAYLGIYDNSGWHQSGASGPTEWLSVHKKRFSQITGTYPTTANGEYVPTCSRSSSKISSKSGSTYPMLYRVGNNWEPVVKRYEKSGTSLVSGLLVEKAATNLNTYSEDIPNFKSGYRNVTCTENEGIAPDGTHTADAAYETTTAARHVVDSQNISVTNGETYCASVYVKRIPGCSRNARIWFGNYSGNVNLGNGAASSYTHTNVENVGDGWFRVSTDWDCTSTGTKKMELHILSDTFVEVYAGDVTKGVYWWGMQIESGRKTPSSYIKTEGATATRNADTFYYDGTSNWPDGYGTLEWNILSSNLNIADAYMMTLTDGGAASDSIMSYLDSNKYTDIKGNKAGTTEISIDGDDVISDGYEHIFRTIIKPDETKLYVDDIQDGSNDTSCNPPKNIDRIVVGGDASNTNGVGEPTYGIKIWDGYQIP